MNSVNSKSVKFFTSFLVLVVASNLAQAWDVDLSRRKLDFDRISDQNRLPASEQTISPSSKIFSVEDLVPSMQPVQDIVILNTEKGFIPEKVVVRKGEAYKIHLVNVHPDKKNISFILDDFAESHSTPYAKEKQFELRPKKAGEYSFHCPETSYRGRVIVIDTDRKPASN